MSTRVIVNGAFGKMGSIACATLRKHQEFELVATLGRQDNLRAVLKQTPAHIVIDLTCADCVYENSMAIIEAGIHPIIGTTGLKPEEITMLQQHCKQQQLGGFIVPNFSLSAILMMHFASAAARLLPEVEIIEAHHPQKLDAPSGTAIKTAKLIADAREANHMTHISTDTNAAR